MSENSSYPPLDPDDDDGYDFRLMGLLEPDEAFRQAARNFMRRYAPSAHAVYLRPQLRHFWNAFFHTSQDVLMQELLLELHTRYSLDWLADSAFIASIRQNVLALQASRAAAYAGVATPLVPQLPLPQTRPPMTLNQNGQDGLSRQFQFVHVSMEEAAAIRDVDTEDAELEPANVKGTKRRRVRQPDQPALRIDAKHPLWLYECDRCGHCRRYRHEFQRHIRQQGIRAGFEVDRTLTSEAPFRWHAKDAAGNEYCGKMVYDPAGPVKNKGGQAPRIPPPCGKGNGDEDLDTEDEAAIKSDN